MNNDYTMKKINIFLEFPITVTSKRWSLGQVDTNAMKFRLKIDTLSELHDQLRHFEFYECNSFTSA